MHIKFNEAFCYWLFSAKTLSIGKVGSCGHTCSLPLNPPCREGRVFHDGTAMEPIGRSHLAICNLRKRGWQIKAGSALGPTPRSNKQLSQWPSMWGRFPFDGGSLGQSISHIHILGPKNHLWTKCGQRLFQREYLKIHLKELRLEDASL